jgi:hypothetical protein
MLSDAYARLKARLSIDPMRLDDELIELPALLMEANEAAAEAVSMREVAKNELAMQQALIADRLRREPGDGKKKSETQISSEIALSPEYHDVLDRVEQAKHEAALWLGLVDGFKTKASALKSVADLIVSGYLAPNAAYNARRNELKQKRVALRLPVDARA